MRVLLSFAVIRPLLRTKEGHKFVATVSHCFYLRSPDLKLFRLVSVSTIRLFFERRFVFAWLCQPRIRFCTWLWSSTGGKFPMKEPERAYTWD